MCQYDNTHRTHNVMVKYFQKVSCVHAGLHLLNNGCTVCWHREERNKRWLIFEWDATPCKVFVKSTILLNGYYCTAVQ